MRRQWLYLVSYDVGQIFEGEDAIAAAKADGWTEHPDGNHKPERVEETLEPQSAEPVKRRRGRPPKVRSE